jgi:DNA-binding CsgD family transcriptional regulator
LRRHAQLSEREQICIALLLEGKTLQAIATDIALSRGSVNTNIMGAIAKMRRHI